MLVQIPNAALPIQLSANVLEKAADAGSPPATIEFLAPGLQPEQPQPLWPFGEWSED